MNQDLIDIEIYLKEIERIAKSNPALTVDILKMLDTVRNKLNGVKP